MHSVERAPRPRLEQGTYGRVVSVSQVVDSVKKQLSVREVMPPIWGDPAFRHLPAVGGLDILITGGPAIDSYFLRATHRSISLYAGLRSSTRPVLLCEAGGYALQSRWSSIIRSRARLASSNPARAEATPHGVGPVKRVQILQQDGQRAAPATNPPTTGSTGSSSSTRPRGSSLEDPPAPISR